MWILTTSTHRLDARQQADIASEVSRLEQSLVISLEVDVYHQRLQLLTNDPGFVFYIPAKKNSE